MRRYLHLALILLPLTCLGETGIFSAHAPLTLSLTGPLERLSVKTRNELPFMLEMDAEKIAVNVRKRGKSRARICKFPPLRLAFSEADATGTPFEGISSLKLVTHCRDREASHQDVLEEYLAYRLYNELTEASFRVRLALITYTDPEADFSVTAWGFFIEPTGQLGERLDAEKLEPNGVSTSAFSAASMVDMYVFQYMIGNTDFSLVRTEGEKYCCHNGRIFQAENEEIYVPYDFDLAGIVNARYAYPHPSLRLSSVTKRRYRGFCDANPHLRGSLARFTSLQPRLTDIAGLPDIPDFFRTHSTEFLDSFFEELKTPEKLLRNFERRCL